MTALSYGQLRKWVVNVLCQTIDATIRMKNLLYVVAAIYMLSSVVGYVLIYLQTPFAVAYVKRTKELLSVTQVFSPILNSLRAGNLPLAIAYVFLWNLLDAAFLTNTLPGVVPLAGALLPLALSALHGFQNGLILYHAFGVSLPYSAVAVGTAVLELSAYVFAAAAGINISLSAAYPRRYRVRSRMMAFRMAWRDAARLYIIITILLAVAATWEIVGLYLIVVRG